MIPSASPISTWSLGSKEKSGISPQRRISTFSVSSLPMGESGWVMLGIFNCSSRNFSSTSRSSSSLEGSLSFMARDSSMSRLRTSWSRSFPMLFAISFCRCLSSFDSWMRAERRSASSTTSPTSASTPRCLQFSSTATTFSRINLRSSKGASLRSAGFRHQTSAMTLTAFILACQLLECPVLRSDTDEEECGVQDGEDYCGDPGPEDERERKYLDGNHDVVGMGEIAVRSTTDDLTARHDEYSRVPVHAKSDYCPVPQRLHEQERHQRHGPPRRDLGPAQ